LEEDEGEGEKGGGGGGGGGVQSFMSLITGQVSKTGTRTPPRENNAWWSQETVYRLDEKKDNCC